MEGALLIWPWLERKLTLEAEMPFDHETVIRRYETNCRVQLKAFYSGKCKPCANPGLLDWRCCSGIRNCPSNSGNYHPAMWPISIG